jgi:hypothetical protein
MRRGPVARCAALAAMTCIASLAGCAIRQDAAGVSRVGIGLWGFGDPPGVDWNLDWPRREPAALPPARHSPDGGRFVTLEAAADVTAVAVEPEACGPADDDRGCAHRRTPALPPVDP